MRILVTGSRDWPYPEVVYRELSWVKDNSKFDKLIVVEGACIYGGADEFAHTWAEDMKFSGEEVDCERHPADWEKHGKSAGFIRNQEMVDLGADLCLAFRFNSSKGTTHTIERARAAGIPVRVIDVTIEGP